MTQLFFLAMLAAQPIESGWLRVQTQPRVEVVWEGVSLGRTNETGLLLVEEIPSGSFSVVLRGAGYESLERTVDITPGRNSLAVLLTEIESPPLVEPARERPAGVSRKPDVPTTVAPEAATPSEPVAPIVPEPTNAENAPTPIQPSRTPAADTGASSAAPSLLWVVAILAAGGLAAVAWRNRSALAATPRARSNRHTPRSAPPPAPPEEPILNQEKNVGEPPDFLSALRQRERQLDEPGVKKGPDEAATGVIDVEYREVADGESEGT